MFGGWKMEVKSEEGGRERPGRGEEGREQCVQSIKYTTALCKGLLTTPPKTMTCTTEPVSPRRRLQTHESAINDRIHRKSRTIIFCISVVFPSFSQSRNSLLKSAVGLTAPCWLRWFKAACNIYFWWGMDSESWIYPFTVSEQMKRYSHVVQSPAIWNYQ